MYLLVRELAVDGIPVTVTCRVLKLARQPYYRWLACPVSDRELEQAYLANALFDAHHRAGGGALTATHPDLARGSRTDLTCRVGCVLEASRAPADVPALVRALRAAGWSTGRRPTRRPLLPRAARAAVAGRSR